jgi:hypothetical protein
MITTMEIAHRDSAGKPFTSTCIVTVISVKPRKPIGVKVEVSTLCGSRHHIRNADITV